MLPSRRNEHRAYQLSCHRLPPNMSHIATDTEHAKNTLFQPGTRHRNSTRCSAYTSAMFSQTRDAMNGDLRVACRASRDGARDIVFVSHWFTCRELLPELPSLVG